VRPVHRLEVTLPGVASSVPPARHFVERTLEAWDLASVGWTAALLVTELAANAALHAGTEFTVGLSATDGRVRIEVSDRSTNLPRTRQHSPEATTGRGLRLVADLSAEWGVQPEGAGKTVWAELSTALPAAEDDTEDDDLDALLDRFADEVDDAPDLTGPGRTTLRLAA
jgi:anti-sigma regulatory factor (Ser/Thr protein kinase)